MGTEDSCLQRPCRGILGTEDSCLQRPCRGILGTEDFCLQRPCRGILAKPAVLGKAILSWARPLQTTIQGFIKDELRIKL